MTPEVEHQLTEIIINLQRILPSLSSDTLSKIALREAQKWEPRLSHKDIDDFVRRRLGAH